MREPQRKIVSPAPSLKDENGQYVRPEPSSPEAKAEPSSDIDLSFLLDRCRVALERDIKHIVEESSEGKLSAASARDLVNYVKLLHELKENEEDVLENMSAEELQAALDKKEFNGESSSRQTKLSSD